MATAEPYTPVALTSGGWRLCGMQRLVVAVGHQPREPASAFLEFKLGRVNADGACRPVPTLPVWNTPTSIAAGLGGLLADPLDTIVFNADVGSYLVRPNCTVDLVVETGTGWTAMALSAFDPCACAQRFWWTRTFDRGPLAPPPFYHRVRVMGGVVTRDGVQIERGFDFAMPAGQLTVVERAIVQWGLDL